MGKNPLSLLAASLELVRWRKSKGGVCKTAQMHSDSSTARSGFRGFGSCPDPSSQERDGCGTENLLTAAAGWLLLMREASTPGVTAVLPRRKLSVRGARGFVRNSASGHQLVFVGKSFLHGLL